MLQTLAFELALSASNQKSLYLGQSVKYFANFELLNSSLFGLLDWSLAPELTMSTETNNVDVAPVDAAPAPAAPAEATPSAAAPAPSAAAPVAAPKVQSYDEAFPGLGGGPAPTQAAVSWFNNPMKSIKSSTTSTTFQIPFEQRRFRPGAATEFGKGTAGDRGKAECLKIMNETKVGFRPAR